MTHIVYIPFTGVGIDHRNDDWLKERVEIFKNYTLKSLANQSNKDFFLWLSFRPQDLSSLPMKPYNQDAIAQLLTAIDRAGIECEITFHGLMYHDDKFGGSVRHRIWNAGRLVRAAWRHNTWMHLPYSLWQMLFRDKNKTLEKRLAESLESLKWSGRIKDDIVLLTRIDSDDMFHKEALEKIRDNGGSVVAMSGGYIYDTKWGRLAYYNPKTNPPFHTIGFSKEEFLDARRHLLIYGDFKSHEDIIKLHPHTLTERLYCVTTHNPKAHISTVFDHPYRGKMIGEPERSDILKQFGI